MADTRKGSARTPRVRRSEDERIAALQAEIERLELQKRKKELGGSEQFKALSKALRALDAALESANALGDSSMKHAVAGSRMGLAAYMEQNGWPVSKVDLPKGRVPKDIMELRSQTAQALERSEG